MLRLKINEYYYVNGLLKGSSINKCTEYCIGFDYNYSVIIETWQRQNWIIGHQNGIIEHIVVL